MRLCPPTCGTAEQRASTSNETGLDVHWPRGRNAFTRPEHTRHDCWRSADGSGQIVRMSHVPVRRERRPNSTSFRTTVRDTSVTKNTSRSPARIRLAYSNRYVYPFLYVRISAANGTYDRFDHSVKRQNKNLFFEFFDQTRVYAVVVPARRLIIEFAPKSTRPFAESLSSGDESGHSRQNRSPLLTISRFTRTDGPD